MRIVVVPSSETLLSPIANQVYAEAVSAALQNQEIPAVAGAPRPGDWRLALRTVRQGAMVTPVFGLISPAGREQGAEHVRAVPLEAWRRGQPAMRRDVAKEAAPRVARLLAAVDAARRQTAPTSLDNRPRRVAVVEVTGAPGDGDVSLLRLMRAKLAQLGPVVQESAAEADFVVKAQVTYRPVNARTQHIRIVWLIQNARGEEVGRMEQQNDVPKGTLDRYWGDVAVVVTDEAAVALRDVIMNQAGQRLSGPVR